MASKKKRAMVTGGAGFLGSHLCERLISEGYSVVCVDNLSTGASENVAHLEREEDVIASASSWWWRRYP